jgi:acetyltransferase-like isoleucine patch superfamily enzyme
MGGPGTLTPGSDDLAEFFSLRTSKMSTDQDAIDRLSHMIRCAGWENDGWGFELGFVDRDSFCFVEKNCKGSLVDLVHQSKHVHDVFFGRGTYMLTGTISPHVVVGRYCSISRNVSLGPSNHVMNELSMGWAPRPARTKKDKPKYTVIGSDVWIGMNAVILQGKTVGHGAAIGANCVITKDVPPYAVVVGNPGRVVRYRFDEKTIEELLETKWWMLPEEAIGLLPHEDVPRCLEVVPHCWTGWRLG